MNDIGDTTQRLSEDTDTLAHLDALQISTFQEPVITDQSAIQSIIDFLHIS